MRMKTDKLVLENVKYESSITHPTRIFGAVMDSVALNILKICILAHTALILLRYVARSKISVFCFVLFF